VSTEPRPRPLLLDIWIAGELMGSLLDRNLALEGVDTDFYGTLSVIGAFGPLTPSELAERVGAPLTTVSDRLRRIVEDGDAERIPNPDDGRSHLVRLTAEGDARWRRGWPALRRTIEQISENLERPVEEVHDVIEDLIEALRAGSRTRLTPTS
jgi:DNA-binding MarR family transcriptional regulator